MSLTTQSRHTAFAEEVYEGTRAERMRGCFWISAFKDKCGDYELGCNITPAPYGVQTLVMEGWMNESGDEVSRHSHAVLGGYDSRVPCNGVYNWRRTASESGKRGDEQADSSSVCS